VFAIAKRRVKRALFRRGLLLPLDSLLNHRHQGPDPERAAIANDQRTRLRSAIRRLPHAEREALLLVIGGGQTINEAAVVSGISNSAMKMVREWRIALDKQPPYQQIIDLVTTWTLLRPGHPDIRFVYRVKTDGNGPRAEIHLSEGKIP